MRNEMIRQTKKQYIQMFEDLKTELELSWI